MSKKSPDALTKNDLVKILNRKAGLTHLAAIEAVNATLDAIADALIAGKHCEFRDFGVFRRVKRNPRVGRNPKDPAGPVRIPSSETIRFKPGKVMRCICGKEK